jgi:hypothetical protein
VSTRFVRSSVVDSAPTADNAGPLFFEALSMKVSFGISHERDWGDADRSMQVIISGVASLSKYGAKSLVTKI